MKIHIEAEYFQGLCSNNTLPHVTVLYNASFFTPNIQTEPILKKNVSRCKNELTSLWQHRKNHQAMFLQRLHYGADKVRHTDAYRRATQGSARLLGRNDNGEISIGKRADLALFKLDELRFSGHHDPLAALLPGGANQADRVMIEGQWNVVNGTLPDTDIKDLKHRHQLAARVLANLM